MSATATVVKQRKLWMDQYRPSSQQSSQDLTIAYDDQENTTTEDAIHTFQPGIPAFEFSAEGFNSYGTGSIEAVTWPILDAGTQVLLAVSLQTGAAGEKAYAFQGKLYSYEQPITVPDLAGFTLAAKPNAPVVRCWIAKDDSAAVTGNGSGTAYQVGAAAAGKSVYGQIHCTAFNGTSLDVIVESDNAEGFASPVTRASFAQLTGVGKERVSAAGPITDDWWRVSWTLVGTSATFAALIGIE